MRIFLRTATVVILTSFVFACGSSSDDSPSSSANVGTAIALADCNAGWDSLQTKLSTPANEAAALLFWFGDSGTCTAEVLHRFYLTDEVTTVTIMRDAGYDHHQVYAGLKASFDANMNTAEPFLIGGGFSEDEAFAAVLPDLLAWFDGLIEQYGPVVYLHPNEPYEMSSVEWFLDLAELYYELDGFVQIYDTKVSKESLPQVMDELRELGVTKTWFGTPDPVNSPADDRFKSPGNQDSAKAYIHANRVKHLGYTDLQFWLWYPYNGPGSFNPAIELRALFIPWSFEDGDDESDAGNTLPLGEHTSDWENVVLRFDNDSGELLKVFMSAHGHYSPYEPDNGDIDFENGQHVVVYSALNGHALFPKQGDNPNEELSVDKGLGLVFTMSAVGRTLNWTRSGGKSLQAHQDFEIVAVDDRYLDSNRDPVQDSWAKYTGKWGPDVDYNLSERQKREVLLNIGGDIVLSTQLAFPLIAAESCAALATVGAAVCLLGYPACWVAIFKSCTIAAITIVEVAIPIGLHEYAGAALDGAFEDQSGTGKPSPGSPSRKTEWEYLQTVSESPRFVQVDTPGSGYVVGETMVQVAVSSHHKTQNQFGDHSPEAIEPYLIEVDEVMLQIGDDIYETADLLRSENIQSDGSTLTIYSIPWDTTSVPNGDYELHSWVVDIDGTRWEYDWDRPVVTVCNDCLLSLSLAVDKRSIIEGDSVEVRGSFITPTAAASISVDWGDGSPNDVIFPIGGTKENFPEVGGSPLTHIYTDNKTGNEEYVITMSLSEDGVSAQSSTSVAVFNQVPAIDSFNRSPGLGQAGTAVVNSNIQFSDAGSGDTHEVAWDWDDGEMSLSGSPVASPEAAQHTYLRPGVYRASAAVTDDDGGSISSQVDGFFVAYPSDPEVAAGVGYVNMSRPEDLADPNSPLVDVPGYFGFYLNNTGATPEHSLRFAIDALEFSNNEITCFESVTSYECPLNTFLPNEVLRLEGIGTFNDIGLFDSSSRRFVATIERNQILENALGIEYCQGVEQTLTLTVFGLDDDGNEIVEFSTGQKNLNGTLSGVAESLGNVNTCSAAAP